MVTLNFYFDDVSYDYEITNEEAWKIAHESFDEPEELDLDRLMELEDDPEFMAWCEDYYRDEAFDAFKDEEPAISDYYSYYGVSRSDFY